MSQLKDRFISFCRKMPGAEEIDALLTREQCTSGLKIADFFFQTREVVCEIKALETDTSQKLIKLMAQHGIDLNALKLGEHKVRELFLELPDGERLYRKATDLIVTPIADGFDDAEKQIRDTKEMFRLPSADGLLVILNGMVQIVGPPLIMQRLSKRVGKRAEDGSRYHKDITRILHIGEMYAVETPDGDKLFNMTLPNPYSIETHGVEAFVVKLAEAWATFNGHTFTKAGPEFEALMKTSELAIDVDLGGDKKDA